MRKRLTGELNVTDLSRVLARIHEDRLEWKLVDVSASVLRQGKELVQKTSLRTLDAIHRASVIVFRSAASGYVSALITADARRAAAMHLGLEVVWIG